MAELDGMGAGAGREGCGSWTGWVLSLDMMGALLDMSPEC